MNRRILFALYASAAMAAPAMAQDTFNWNGFYAGINAGYSGGQFRTPVTGTFNAPPNSYTLNGRLSINGSGFTGGGQFGYNHLLSSNWLIGVEADAQASAISPKLTGAGPLGTLGTYDIQASSKLDFFGTGRVRAGYVMPETNALIYGTAGVAYGGVGINAKLHAQSSTDHADAAIDRYGVDVGWTAGAGFEYPVTDRLTLRAEYLYVDLGRHKIFDWTLSAPQLTGNGSLKVESDAHVGRLALNYAL